MTTSATSARCGGTVRAAAAAQRTSAEAVHPDPEAWPAVVAGGRLWERSAGGSRLRARCALGRGAQRLGHPPDPAGRPAPPDGLGAGHRARAAPVPDGAHRGPRSAGRAVVAGDGHDLARTATGAGLRRALARARRRAVRAVAQPGRRAARRGRPHRRTLAGVGVGASGCRTTPIRGMRDGAGPLRMFTARASTTLRRWWADREPAQRRAAPARRRRRRGRRDGPVGRRSRASPCCGSGRLPGDGRRRRWCACG